MHHWVHALIGGTLLGAGAGVLVLGSGRLAGVGGIVGGIVHPVRGDVAWRLVFVGCLLLGGLAGGLIVPDAIVTVGASPQRIALGGLLIGLGTRVGNGCTSGHGVCGVGRLSPRSFLAVTLFTAAGALTRLAEQQFAVLP